MEIREGRQQNSGTKLGGNLQVYSLSFNLISIDVCLQVINMEKKCLNKKGKPGTEKVQNGRSAQKKNLGW